MNYPFNPFQGGGFVPMSYQFQPPFNRNYGFYPNWNGSYQSAQTNFPQITNGQQQGNPYGVLNQGTPVNNNPAFNGNNGFYPNWNGSYQSAQTNIPQIINGQQQGNSYGVLNQGTPVNNNPAFNGNNGGLCLQNYNQPSQSLQMNPGQQQVALASVAQPMPENHVNNATNLNTPSTFENGSLLMAKYATDAALSAIERVGPNGKCSFKVNASPDKYGMSFDHNQNN